MITNKKILLMLQSLDLYKECCDSYLTELQFMVIRNITCHNFPNATAVVASPMSPSFLVFVFCDVAKS